MIRMTTETVLIRLKKLLESNNTNYNIDIYDDHIVLYQSIGENRVDISFRCQNFGNTIVMQSMGARIFVYKIEVEFEGLLLNELTDYNNSNYSLVGGKNEIPLMNEMRDTIFSSLGYIEEYVYDVLNFLNGVEKSFFLPMLNIDNLALNIGVPFEERSKVLVGGRFPVHLLKKIFILKKGGQEQRYEEYKSGLEGLFELYKEKKPTKKEELKLYWKAYRVLIENLESSETNVEQE